MMDYKKAIETLRPMADNYVLPGVVDAMETAIRAMEELPKAQAERDDAKRLIEQLLEDLQQSDSNAEGACGYCKHGCSVLPCADISIDCNEECPHRSFPCCTCFDGAKYHNWEWRGIPDKEE